jgi:hypothetical protein
MQNILSGKRILITGPVASYAGPIARSILFAAPNTVVAFIADDDSGAAIEQAFKWLAKTRGVPGPKIAIVKPAQDLHTQLKRVAAVEVRDGTALIVAKDFSRDVIPLADGHPWPEWQFTIAQNLHCSTLTLASHADHFPTPLDTKHWDSCWKIVDGHPAPPKERFGIRFDLVCTKPGLRTVKLVGKNQGVVFEEVKEPAHV